MPVIGVPILKSILGRRLGFSTRTPQTASNLIVEGGIVTGNLSGNPVTTTPTDLAAISTTSGVATLRSSGGTATAVAGAATLNKPCGIITTESLTTAAAATYTLTITNNQVLATDIVQIGVGFGTCTTGVPTDARVNNTAGTITAVIQNIGSAAFNGTLLVSFFILRPA